MTQMINHLKSCNNFIEFKILRLQIYFCSKYIKLIIWGIRNYQSFNLLSKFRIKLDHSL
jgi:hypothetical protein